MLERESWTKCILAANMGWIIWNILIFLPFPQDLWQVLMCLGMDEHYYPRSVPSLAAYVLKKLNFIKCKPHYRMLEFTEGYTAVYILRSVKLARTPYQGYTSMSPLWPREIVHLTMCPQIDVEPTDKYSTPTSFRCCWCRHCCAEDNETDTKKNTIPVWPNDTISVLLDFLACTEWQIFRYAETNAGEVNLRNMKWQSVSVWMILTPPK